MRKLLGFAALLCMSSGIAQADSQHSRMVHHHRRVSHHHYSHHHYKVAYLSPRAEHYDGKTSQYQGKASFYHARGARGCAHRSLPFGTHVRVTNLANQQSTTLVVNDRGPFIKGRVIDVSVVAADQLGFRHAGLAPVRVDVLPD